MKPRKRVQFSSDLPSMTQQNLKESCDVNSILKKYHATGRLDHIRQSPGQYGDFTTIPNFRESMDIVSRGNQSFMELPAELRKRFGNDPSELIEFINNPSNLEEAIKLGIMVSKPQPQNDDQTTITPPQATQDPL